MEDIKGECESFGKVVAFIIPNANADLHSKPDSDSGVVFVRFEMITAAAKAYESLNGRDFDGNTVKASFIPAGSI